MGIGSHASGGDCPRCGFVQIHPRLSFTPRGVYTASPEPEQEAKSADAAPGGAARAIRADRAVQKKTSDDARFNSRRCQVRRFTPSPLSRRSISRPALKNGTVLSSTWTVTPVRMDCARCGRFAASP